jgi:lipoprotein-anchoring transpeptidase ErfK/SrfK
VSARKQKFQINPLYAPQEVSILDIPFDAYLAPGSILIDSDNKFLYFILDADTARRYGVAIGKEGLGWYGTANVKEKVEWPSWIPTAEMMERDPDKYLSHKDGIPGGPGNPLGARAIYLFQGDEDTHIRIHGTTQPWTIGKAASNGCFRMVNDHVIDLYNRVQIGAQVIVI